MMFAINSARAFVSSSCVRTSAERYHADSSTTVSVTRAVTPATCFVFRPSGMGRRSLLRLGLTHPVQFVVERLEADAKQFGRARFVAPGVGECDVDQLPLHLVDRRAGRETRSGLVAGRRGGERRQVGRLDETTLRHDGRALEDVPQFTHVAGPGVPLEQAHRRVADAPDRAAVAAIRIGDERLDEDGQIVLAVAEGRQLDREHVQPVIEVFAKLVLPDGLERLDVRRRDDANVDALFALAADRPKCPLLEDPEELRLGGGGHLGNLVEKQRAPVRQLERSLPARDGPGECALLVAEELALEQRVRNGRAVDRYERVIGARADQMHRLGDEFLAGPGLAADEDRGVGRCGLLDDFVHFLHRPALADHLAERAVLPQLLAEHPDLAQCAMPLDDLVEQDPKPLRIDGLRDVIVRAELDRLDRRFDRALGREQDDGDFRVLLLQRLEQVEAAHTRHHQVGDDDRRTDRRRQLEGLFTVAGRRHLEAPALHELLEADALGRLVFDDKHPIGGHHTRGTVGHPYILSQGGEGVKAGRRVGGAKAPSSPSYATIPSREGARMKPWWTLALIAAAVTVGLAPVRTEPAPAGGAQASSPKTTLYLVATAHLDSQWNWTVQDTIRDHIPKTFHTNFDYFEKYPNYVFSWEGAIHYMWFKEYHPDEWARVQQYVASGRWRLAGSWIDAVDVNMPSPESLFRQALYGERFFRQEFNGKESHDVYLPDCFGFGFALPSIAAHSGLVSFSTQKLTWGRPIPFPIGRWRGVDGSEIIAELNPGSYTTSIRDELTPATTNGGRADAGPWLNDPTPIGNNQQLEFRYFGTGDTGGGPSEASVQFVNKALANPDPALAIKNVAPDQLARDLTPAERAALPVYNDELILKTHGTGCYTSQAAMKRFNRTNELLADAAEKSGVAASVLTGEAYPSDRLREAWIRFIWHQFHDDLTGTCIPQAYQFSWNDELASMNQFAGVLTSSTSAVSSLLDTTGAGVPLVVYNPVSMERTEPIEATVKMAAAASVKIVDA